MENWTVAVFIFGAVLVAMIGQGWASLLEHQRRKQALDVIKTVLASGREPPQQLYDLLREAQTPKAPWSEVVIFSALSIGFWIAFAYSDGDRRVAFLVVAATMTFTALACLGLALFRRPGGPADDGRQ